MVRWPPLCSAIVFPSSKYFHNRARLFLGNGTLTFPTVFTAVTFTPPTGTLFFFVVPCLIPPSLLLRPSKFKVVFAKRQLQLFTPFVNYSTRDQGLRTRRIHWRFSIVKTSLKRFRLFVNQTSFITSLNSNYLRGNSFHNKWFNHDH